MKTKLSYWDLVEPVWERISIYDGPSVFHRQSSRAPKHTRNLFAAHWCQSEIRNGGFSQFFYNPTGVLAPEAVSAFKEIGMLKTSTLVQRAMRKLGTPYPRHRSKRIAALNRLDSDFEELSREFFKLTRSEAGGFGAAADTYARGGANKRLQPIARKPRSG